MKTALSLIGCILSLLLSIALAALWLRSEQIGENIDLFHVRQPRQVRDRYAFSNGAGVLCFNYRHTYFNRPVTEREVHSTVGDVVEPLPASYERMLPRQAARYHWPVSRDGLGWGFLFHDAGDFKVGMIHDPPNLVERERWWTIAAPHWFLVLLTAVMPVTWVIAILRRRRLARRGLCRRCGYDLRATPGRCTECGMFVRQH